MSGNSERGRAAHASPGLWPTPMTGISPGGDRKGRRDSGGAQIVIRTRPVVAVVVVAVELDVGAAVSMLAFMVALSSVKEAA
jgi:hypothetical protein